MIAKSKPRHRRNRVDWVMVLAGVVILAILAAIALTVSGGNPLRDSHAASLRAGSISKTAPLRTTPFAVAVMRPAKTPQIDSKGSATPTYPSYRVASKKPPTATTEPARATSAAPTPSATSKAPTPTPTPTTSTGTPTPSASPPPTTAPAVSPSATST